MFQHPGFFYNSPLSIIMDCLEPIRVFRVHFALVMNLAPANQASFGV